MEWELVISLYDWELFISTISFLMGIASLSISVWINNQEKHHTKLNTANIKFISKNININWVIMGIVHPHKLYLLLNMVILYKDKIIKVESSSPVIESICFIERR